MSNRAACGLVVAGLAFVLGGCVESMPDFKALSGGVRPAVAAETGSSRPSAAVAMVSLDGAPERVASLVDRAFAKAAGARAITIVEPSTAGYLVRGYLNASPRDSGGTDVSFVYDIFDAADQRRIDRVSDVLTLPATDTDPWTLVDDRVAASLAGRSADGLAAALATTDTSTIPPPMVADAAPATQN